MAEVKFKTKEQIEEEKNAVKEPTTEERLAALEAALMGVL